MMYQLKAGINLVVILSLCLPACVTVYRGDETSCGCRNSYSQPDSFRLVFIDDACMCPHWIDYDHYMTQKDSSNYDVYRFGYFEEAIDSACVLDGELYIQGNVVTFFGTADNYVDQVWFPGSPPTHWLKYCGYSVHHPYKKWIRNDNGEPVKADGP